MLYKEKNNTYHKEHHTGLVRGQIFFMLVAFHLQSAQIILFNTVVPSSISDQNVPLATNYLLVPMSAFLITILLWIVYRNSIIGDIGFIHRPCLD